MKRCPVCQAVKPLDQFPPRNDRPGAVMSRCHDCDAARCRDYYQRTKGAAARARYKRNHPSARSRPEGPRTPEEKREAKRQVSRLNQLARHGMRPEDWAALHEAQRGLCYLCEQPLAAPGSRQIHVDHDHSHCPRNASCSACRRGLACHLCNTAIGLLGDDPERMRLVASNLERALAVARERISLIQAEPELVLFG